MANKTWNLPRDLGLFPRISPKWKGLLNISWVYSRYLLKFWLKAKHASYFEGPFCLVVNKVGWKELVTKFEQNWRLVGFPTSRIWKKSELLLTWYLRDVVLEGTHKIIYVQTAQLLALLHGKQHFWVKHHFEGEWEEKTQILWISCE